MSKITVISCIIAAVCVFQIAEAGFLDTALLNSILGNVKDQMSNHVQNVQDTGLLDDLPLVNSVLDTVKDQVLSNAGKEPRIQNKRGIFDISKLTNGLVADKNEFPISVECTNAFIRGQDAIQQMTSTFSSCMNGNKANSLDVAKLTDAINNLNVSQNVQDMFSCLQNPMEIFTCILNVLQNIQSNVGPVLGETVNTAHNIMEIIPNVRMCVDKTIQQLSGQVMSNLVGDMGQCVGSVLPFKFQMSY